MFKFFSRLLDQWIVNPMNQSELSLGIKTIVLFIFALLLAWIVWRISKWLIMKTVPRITAKTKTLWDDILFNPKVLAAFAIIIPALLVDFYTHEIFQHYSMAGPIVTAITEVLVIFVVSYIIASFLSGARDFLQEKPEYIDKPLSSYVQLSKIIIYGIATILALSVIFEKSPVYLLSGFGAMAAIILLVFKDTILGFVASVQLSANNMVHVGDWVTVPKYHADGDVQEINLATIKVQNFDKTITMVPTYAFISDSFTNWRGMQQSEGRRIKRSVQLAIDSVKFCDQELLERFKKFNRIKDYILQKEADIREFNASRNMDTSVLLNGRNLTNIGVFRVYLLNYLKGIEHLNQDMTMMVRQLPPTTTGVPIEIYAFSKHKEWVTYENIMGDIMDHVLAVVPSFDLRIFENPSGAILKGIHIQGFEN